MLLAYLVIGEDL